MARLPVKRTVSAGGVVCRHGQKGIEVLLVGRTSLGIWGLPKGAPVDGETVEMAARREVQEETGLKVEIEVPLGSVRYWFTRVSEGFRFDKTVHFFLMKPVGGDIANHDREYDEVRWFPLDEALRTLSYRNEAALVRQAAGLLAGAPEPATGRRGENEKSNAA